LGLPTALQLDPHYALLFYKDGVYQFTGLELDEVYGSLMSPGPGRIWALIDSNQDLVEPTGVFSTGRPFFVVEAANPRPARLQWLKRLNSQDFYMKRWSFSEVLQAYVDFYISAHITHVSAVVRSLGTQPPTQKMNSGTYTKDTEHLPRRWLITLAIQRAMKMKSPEKFGFCTLTC
jgi:hypothetical protein